MNTTDIFQAPIIDSLSVRVVVDSRYERFMPKAEHPALRIEHVGVIPEKHMHTFACEWGLSLHIATETRAARAQYLLDFGFTPDVLVRNFELMNLDSAKLDGLILSHGHRDHFGGLDGFVDNFQGAFRPDLDLIVGGETVFREKFVKSAEGEMVSWGALDREHLHARHIGTRCCGEPHALPGAFTTGYIERQSFETVTGGTMVADYDHYTEDERGGKLVKDTHPDEHATCFIIQGRGLVVISSCGHVGLINTIKTAMAVANVDKLHAVLGGFHLGLAPNDYIENTVDELEALDPDVVVPMHCSGEKFINAMRARLPDKLVTSNVGSTFTFGG